MIFSENELLDLSRDIKIELLDILYCVENELCYKNKKVSKTIDWLQENI